MLITSEQTPKGTLPVEGRAEDIFQDGGAAWDIEEEDSIYISKEGVSSQEPGPNDPPQVPLPIPAGEGTESDYMELLESLQRVYSSFQTQYLGPFIRSSCEYANISPRTAEFVETPIAMSIAFATACFSGAVILLSLTSLTSLLKTFLYHLFIQGVLFYWKVLGTLLVTVVLFFLTSSTLIAGKLVLRTIEPFSGDLREVGIEGLRRAKEQDWPAIGRYIWEHLLVATWAVQSTVVRAVQRRRERRAERDRPRIMRKFKGGKVVLGVAMLVLFSGLNMTFWLVSLGCYLWARKRRS